MEPPLPCSAAFLPRGWPRRVRSGVLHAIFLARVALVSTHAWAASARSRRLRLRAECDRLRQEVSLLREELRLKDARMQRGAAIHLPHYSPTERLAILELRAVRGWSLTQTADRMLVTTGTVSSWMRRLDAGGPDAILQFQTPVNSYPDFVRHLVRRLKVLCPTLGQQKIAQVLCRAGLHLSATTVRRILRRGVLIPRRPPRAAKAKRKPIIARYPNHMWSCDLTAVPIVQGFWMPRQPFALPLRWPLCWWVAVVVDQASRRVLATTAFPCLPSAEQMCRVLAHASRRAGTLPRYLITDQGRQFIAVTFRRWSRARGVRQWFGALDSQGALAISERMNLTLKTECTRRLLLAPLRLSDFQRELWLYRDWFNAHRPHTTLATKTPDEVFFRRRPACCAPRYEPRAQLSRGAGCASPRAVVRGQRGVRLALEVDYVAQRRHLPLVTLRRVA